MVECSDTASQNDWIKTDPVPPLQLTKSAETVRVNYLQKTTEAAIHAHISKVNIELCNMAKIEIFCLIISQFEIWGLLKCIYIPFHLHKVDLFKILNE